MFHVLSLFLAMLVTVDLQASNCKTSLADKGAIALNNLAQMSEESTQQADKEMEDLLAALANVRKANLDLMSHFSNKPAFEQVRSQIRDVSGWFTLINVILKIENLAVDVKTLVMELKSALLQRQAILFLYDTVVDQIFQLETPSEIDLSVEQQKSLTQGQIFEMKLSAANLLMMVLKSRPKISYLKERALKLSRTFLIAHFIEAHEELYWFNVVFWQLTNQCLKTSPFGDESKSVNRILAVWAQENLRQQMQPRFFVLFARNAPEDRIAQSLRLSAEDFARQGYSLDREIGRQRLHLGMLWLFLDQLVN